MFILFRCRGGGTGAFLVSSSFFFFSPPLFHQGKRICSRFALVVRDPKGEGRRWVVGGGWSMHENM